MEMRLIPVIGGCVARTILYASPIEDLIHLLVGEGGVPFIAL